MKNFESDRWPAGNPETGLRNCDGGPIKSLLVSEKDSFYQLAFGKRPREELYDVVNDPDCIFNLALEEKFISIKRQMRKELQKMLIADGDPRALGKGEIFDTYEYVGSSRGFYDSWLKKQRGSNWRAIEYTSESTINGRDGRFLSFSKMKIYDGWGNKSHGKLSPEKNEFNFKSSNGNWVELRKNSWAEISELEIDVSENTFLEFDFMYLNEGEIHGIGLRKIIDANRRDTNSKRIRIAGTQKLFAHGEYQVLGYESQDRAKFKNYKINLSEVYEKGKYTLYFVNDHDVKKPTAHSIFKNIRIYEKEDLN